MGAQRASLCCFLCFHLVFAFAFPVLAETTIGLYSDVSGSTCSFSGNDPGLLTAYVVVRPDGAGVRGVRFAAPVPACLGSIYLGDTAADGMFSVGDSQTGISVAGGECLTTPTYMLAIYYLRSGSTTPCCAYAIGPDTFAGTIDVTTCAQATVSATPVTSHFNANASCPCADDVAPLPPSNPFPLDETIKAFLWPTMTWNAIDWDGDLTEFDVYFGMSASPPLAVAGLNTPSWEHGPLNPLTTYYWRVVVRDALGHETSGPVWHFTTRNANHPPDIHLIFPVGDTDVDRFESLVWSGSDADFDPLRYDVYLGMTNPPPFVSQTTNNGYKQPGGLMGNTTYYWRVVARDEPHSETSSPIAQFTTAFSPTAPYLAADPSPIPGTRSSDATLVNVPLSWQAHDPQDDPVTCDVYFGTEYPPPLVAQNLAKDTDSPYTRYLAGPVTAGKQYYWRILSRDSHGEATLGYMWVFIAGGNHPPSVPSSPTPLDGSTVATTSVTLRWSSYDDDGPTVRSRLYFNGDTGGIPTGIQSWTVGPLVPGGTYSWFVAASDGADVVVGPVWTFHVSGGQLPVLFSSFNARVSGASASLSWTLRSDESLQSYMIYRRSGDDGAPVALVSAPMVGTTGSYVDRTVEGGKTYRYEMVVKAAGGDEYRSQSSTVSMPVFALALEQNHPNPFNPQTTIPYTLPASNAPVRVRLVIYDASGRTVRVLVDEDQSGGAREVVWRGDDASGAAVSSGIYFCVLQAGKERRTQKLVLLK